MSKSTFLFLWAVCSWACFSQRSYLDHAGVAAKMLNVAPVAKMANAIVKNHR